MDDFFSSFPNAGASGVQSVNGLSGALTLAAGSNITITPSGNTLTISSSGGGGGANTALSNLDVTTAINSDLIASVSAANWIIQTVNNSSATKNLKVLTGNSSSAASGLIIISTGVGNTGSGDLSLLTGNATVSGSSGLLQARSGNVTAGSSNTGNFDAGSGEATSSGAGTGNVTLSSGDVSTGAGNSGDVNISSGPTVDGNSGAIILSPSAPAGSGVRGTIQLADGSEGTAGQVWTSTDTIGSGAWAPAAGGAAFQKFSISYTDFTGFVGLDTATINIATLPAGYGVTQAATRVVADFTSSETSAPGDVVFNLGADGPTSLPNNFIVGPDAGPGTVAGNLDRAYSPGGSNTGAGMGVADYSNPTNVTLTIQLSGSATDLSLLTTGSIDVFVKMENLN